MGRGSRGQLARAWETGRSRPWTSPGKTVVGPRLNLHFLLLVLLGFVASLLPACQLVWEPEASGPLTGLPAPELYRTALDVLEADPRITILFSDPDARRLIAARQAPVFRESRVDFLEIRVESGDEAEGQLFVEATTEPAAGTEFDAIAAVYSTDAYVRGPREFGLENELMQRLEDRLRALGHDPRLIRGETEPNGVSNSRP